MKVLSHIDCPKEWESENDFDSHRELLWLCVNNVSDCRRKAVFEMGCGYGSTKLLYDFCNQNEVGFSSVDTNKEWADRFTKETHLITTETYMNVLDPYLPTGILFVDCAPAEIRKDIIEKYRDDVDVIVAHDSEPGAEFCYGMSKILSTFKYRIDYRPEGKPHTTAVSNFINLEQWI
jgi:hypothetical protein